MTKSALQEADEPRRRRRLLMGAFACHPDESMESRIGWRRALLAAETCDVTVLTGPGPSGPELTELAAEQRGVRSGLDFVRVDHDGLSGWFSSSAPLYYFGYRRWHSLAYRAAKQLHATKPFDLAHQVSFCGYREPGLLWKLGTPFVWGPVGGTQNYSLSFLGNSGMVSGAKEVFRNALNWSQLRFSPRVRGAAAAAEVVLAATSTGVNDLRRCLGLRAIRQLETGLDCPMGPPRQLRNINDPLRILWAGRLRAWKGFPLLVEALQQLPPERQVEVRVLGSGPCRSAWRRRAERAGLAHCIEWVEWTDYELTLPHYQWADVFAFTSLRDTSGTGLLESLASGAPIVGLDHQGASDIMTPDCAEPVPVKNPRETTLALAGAIDRLARDPERVLRLSQGAQRRAELFDWSQRVESTRLLYDRAMQRGLPPASSAESEPAPRIYEPPSKGAEAPSSAARS